MRSARGFTLAEVLIATAIIGILASVVYSSFNQAPAQARDTERKADLRTLQVALEQYKKEYGRYPEGCNVGPGDSGEDDAWRAFDAYVSGQLGSGQYECADGSAEYIRNDLSDTTATVENFAPQFIPVLPTDPRLNDEVADSGYLYITNPAGTAYKIMAYNTVEVDRLTSRDDTADNQFSRCGNLRFTQQAICTSVPLGPTPGGVTVASDCGVTNVGEWGNDYALYGGFVPGGGAPYRETQRARDFYNSRIHCW
jgi:prepilin-type N-terminal cleavage/methylation domain-containing protein